MRCSNDQFLVLENSFFAYAWSKHCSDEGPSSWSLFAISANCQHRRVIFSLPYHASPGDHRFLNELSPSASVANSMLIIAKRSFETTFFRSSRVCGMVGSGRGGIHPLSWSARKLTRASLDSKWSTRACNSDARVSVTTSSRTWLKVDCAHCCQLARTFSEGRSSSDCVPNCASPAPSTISPPVASENEPCGIGNVEPGVCCDGSAGPGTCCDGSVGPIACCDGSVGPITCCDGSVGPIACCDGSVGPITCCLASSPSHAENSAWLGRKYKYSDPLSSGTDKTAGGWARSASNAFTGQLLISPGHMSR